MNPVFELNDLHVSLQSHHKEIELVRGVSFAVAPGECLGILGESGSGKSMSMKAALRCGWMLQLASTTTIALRFSQESPKMTALSQPGTPT